MPSINLSAESLVSKKGTCRWWNKEPVNGLHVSRVRVLLGTRAQEAFPVCALKPQSKPRKTQVTKILILSRSPAVKVPQQRSSNLPLSLCFTFQILVNLDRTDLESPNKNCRSPGDRFRHLAHCSCPYWTDLIQDICFNPKAMLAGYMWKFIIPIIILIASSKYSIYLRTPLNEFKHKVVKVWI